MKKALTKSCPLQSRDRRGATQYHRKLLDSNCSTPVKHQKKKIVAPTPSMPQKAVCGSQISTSLIYNKQSLSPVPCTIQDSVRESQMGSWNIHPYPGSNKATPPWYQQRQVGNSNNKLIALSQGILKRGIVRSQNFPPPPTKLKRSLSSLSWSTEAHWEPGLLPLLGSKKVVPSSSCYSSGRGSQLILSRHIQDLIAKTKNCKTIMKNEKNKWRYIPCSWFGRTH